MVEDAHASMAGDFVALEREVHFLDAVALGARAKLGFGPGAPPLKRMQSDAFMSK